MQYGLTLSVAHVDATRRLGELCGRIVPKSTLITLRGRLGAGKTVFVSGLACGLGVKEVTHSPTFTLVSEYMDGRIPLYHIDLYRLGEHAIRDVDLFDEYVFGEGVCAIEWAELLEDALPAERLDVHFLDPTSEEEFLDARKITLSAQGIDNVNVLREWMSEWPY